MVRIARVIWVVAFCVSLGAVSTSFARSGRRGTVTYDGHWWLSASTDEQTGFLNGYFDCYKYDYRGPADFTNNPPDTARAMVTRFYERSSGRLGLLVPDVFYRFRDRPGETVTSGGGVPVKGPHGYFDGDYWRILSAKEQIGYAEGYLWCWKNCLHDKGATFSKAAKTYVSLIGKWYGFNPDTGDISLDHEYDKIADVLYKFRDRNAKSSRPTK